MKGKVHKRCDLCADCGVHVAQFALAAGCLAGCCALCMSMG